MVNNPFVPISDRAKAEEVAARNVSSPSRPGIDWVGGMNGERHPVGEPAMGIPLDGSMNRDALLVELGGKVENLRHQLANSELCVSDLEREVELANASGIVSLQQEVSELNTRLHDAEEICKKSRQLAEEAQQRLTLEQSRNMEISAKRVASEQARIVAETTAKGRQFALEKLQDCHDELRARCDKLSAKLARAEKKLLRKHGPSAAARLGSWMKNSGSRVLRGIYLLGLTLYWLLKWGFRGAKCMALAPLYYLASFAMLPTALSGVVMWGYENMGGAWERARKCYDSDPTGTINFFPPTFYRILGLMLLGAPGLAVAFVYYFCASHLCSLYHNPQFMWGMRMLASVNGFNLDEILKWVFYGLSTTNLISLGLEFGGFLDWLNGKKPQLPVKEENLIDDDDESEQDGKQAPAPIVVSAAPVVVPTPVPSPAKSSDLLEFVKNVDTPATYQDFVARDNFLEGVNPKTGLKLYFGPNFKNWFLSGQGLVEKLHSATSLRCDKLRKGVKDAAIRAELGSAREETTLEEVFHLISRQPKGEKQGNLPADGWWNLFHIKDASGVLRAVHVYWYDDGWLVYAFSVLDPREWGADCRVFSRNSCI